MFNIKNKSTGSMLVLTIIATGLFLVMLMGMISLALIQQKLDIRKVARAQALQIAEAGVNYYRWVLYHDHEEYCNKQTCIGAPNYGPYGPFAYTDSGGEGIVGYYELYIIPPALNGSTVVSIKSVGWVAEYPKIKRTVEVLCGIPSWTSYSTLTNGSDEDLSYGEEAEIWGPIHCNYGLVQMDGIAHHQVTSSLPGEGNYFGVYTCRNGCDARWDGNDPPNNLPDPERDNFLGGRDMGTHIPVVSFNASVGGEYMKLIYAMATSSDGLLFDPAASGSADPYSQAAFRGCQTSGTCAQGFHITFKAGNKFDIRQVSAVYGNVNGIASRSILTESSATEYNVPENGVIFVKHTTWVDGHLDNGASGTRASVYAFKSPIEGSGDADIIINQNLTYSNYDGSDALGLIAQRNVTIGAYCCSGGDLRIDAALLAKTGSRFRASYGSSYMKNSITIYGQTASFLKPYMSGGFNYRYYIYDNNLTFAPPPHYPSTGEYTFISWKEE